MSVQLHVFTLRFGKRFRRVAYIGTEVNDRVDVTFVIVKARVAPVKFLTIHRLELQGALIGTRLAKIATTELHHSIANTTFWTDSIPVLQWIHSKRFRFQTIVANHIGEILGPVPRRKNEDQYNFMCNLLQRFSTWNRLIRAISWYRRPFLIFNNQIKRYYDVLAQLKMEIHSISAKDHLVQVRTF